MVNKVEHKRPLPEEPDSRRRRVSPVEEVALSVVEEIGTLVRSQAYSDLTAISTKIESEWDSKEDNYLASSIFINEHPNPPSSPERDEPTPMDYQNQIEWMESLIKDGDRHLANRELEKALNCYRTANSVKPDSAQPWIKAGELLMLTPQHADALKAFQTAIEINPDSARQCHLNEPMGRLVDADPVNI